MDAVQKAKSGHPGTPMALAPVAFKIWDRFLRFNPKEPEWPNRDRFVLSAGHASMLLYSLLHITGFDLSMDDIKTFRRIGSKCAGHPEYGMVPGVETTTGPLGQGAATSVGMAIAEKWLGSYFNRDGFNVVDYNTYSLLSDGDMMEGITSEAASIAGHLRLDNLIWVYDSNRITIEGSTDLSFSEDVAARFKSYDWDTQVVDDANDLIAIEYALDNSLRHSKPSLIVLHSHIAYGSPNKQDTPEAHGAPLGEDEIKLTKQFYGWDPEKKFHVPDEVISYREEVIERGAKLQHEWNELFSAYCEKFPDLAREFKTMKHLDLPEGWDTEIPFFDTDEKGMATRSANGKIINSVAPKVPWLIGGAGDVGSSTKTYIDGAPSFLRTSYNGRNLHFGIRENAMAAISNGLALSKLRPYCSTYFVFSDYLKAPLRLSSLMKLPVVYIFTHDSIGVGEDGPTHQPVEHLAALRALPDLDVIRPADANELAAFWRYIPELKNRPVALILTRQNVPVIDRKLYSSAENALKGGYIIADSSGKPEIIIIATGSEVYPSIKAYERLMDEDINTRVVSMPCWSIFDSQPDEYRESVLPSQVKRRLSVEAASTLGWERYTGTGELSVSIGMSTYGESAPCDDVMKHFGFTVENIYNNAKSIVES